MGYAAAGVTNAFQSAGGQMEMYGAWYEGQQQRNYLRNQVLINIEQKKEAERKIEMQEQVAAWQFKQADLAYEADMQKVQDFKDQSDSIINSAFVKAAKAGVDLSTGSPLDVMRGIAAGRAKKTEEMKWQSTVDRFGREIQGAITLDAANIARAGLPMYGYQQQLYAVAAEEATRAASQKVISAGLKTGAAAASTWSGSMGGGGGGSQ